MIHTSQETKDLDAALATAQGEIRHALKDAENPFFRARYADLASVWSACREALAKHGLSVSQWPCAWDPAANYVETLVKATQAREAGGKDRDPAVQAGTITMVTRLAHASGQWLQATMVMPVAKQNPQAVGSAITYARRYALAAAVGVAPDDDDDGNAASGNAGKQDEAKPDRPKEPTGDILEEIKSALSSAFPGMDPPAKEAKRAILMRVYDCMAWDAVCKLDRHELIAGLATVRELCAAAKTSVSPPVAGPAGRTHEDIMREATALVAEHVGPDANVNEKKKYTIAAFGSDKKADIMAMSIEQLETCLAKLKGMIETERTAAELTAAPQQEPAPWD